MIIAIMGFSLFYWHPNATLIFRFRYTFAIKFLRNGGNVFVLKELLGHEKLEQTMRYVKFVESDISESAKHSPTDNWRL